MTLEERVAETLYPILMKTCDDMDFGYMPNPEHYPNLHREYAITVAKALLLRLWAEDIPLKEEL